METKFLTPVGLWKNFNTQLDSAPEISYIDFSKKENYSVTKFYFTPIAEEGGKIRGYVEMYKPLEPTSKSILIVGDTLKNQQEAPYYQFIDRGYTVMFLDLTGRLDNNRVATLYQGDFSFGAFKNAKDLLYTATPSAEVSPYFLWSKICRRFLSFAEKELAIEKPIVIASGAFTPVLWHLGGMDERISGIVSLLGSAFNSRLVRKTDLDDNLDRWDTGIAPFTYARLLKCPALIVTASNAPESEHEGAFAIANTIPEGASLSILVSPLLSGQIYHETLDSMARWFDDRFENSVAVPSSPVLEYTLNDAMLDVKVKLPEIDKPLIGVDLWYCFNETNPVFRSWAFKSVRPNEEGSFESKIKVFPDCQVIYAYATATYENQISLSSPLIKVKIPEDAPRCKQIKSQLIYDNTMDKKFFSITKGLFADTNNMQVLKCPLGIPGVSVKSGELASYVVGEDLRFSIGEALQFNAYSLEDKQFEIFLVREIEENQYAVYSTVCNLPGEEGWQKLTISLGDFRDSEMKPLPSWKKLKMIRFKNAEGILFNNMLWV